MGRRHRVCNMVVHEYFGLSWPIVWDTATREVPELARQVAEIVQLEFPEDAGSV